MLVALQAAVELAQHKQDLSMEDRIYFPVLVAVAVQVFSVKVV
jgi:hypothetical protein